MINNPLTLLKDIHNPDQFSIWPLAPGWYILMVMLLIGILLSSIYLLRKYLSQLRRHRVRTELTEIMTHFDDDPQQSFIELSQLVRRIVLAHYKREQVASLQGEAWLNFLDDHCESTEFSQGIGRVLITAPYQKRVYADPHLLNNLVEQLIKRLL